MRHRKCRVATIVGNMDLLGGTESSGVCTTNEKSSLSIGPFEERCNVQRSQRKYSSVCCELPNALYNSQVLSAKLSSVAVSLALYPSLRKGTNSPNPRRECDGVSIRGAT